MITGLRRAVHGVWRYPRLAGTATLLLALGTGTVVAVFSMVDAVALRSLPYPEPSRLYAVERTGRDTSAQNQDAAAFEFLREHTRAFVDLSVIGPLRNLPIETQDYVEFIDSMDVSAGYFETLGFDAESGRIFSAADEQLSAPLVAVVSHDLRRRLVGAGQANGVETILLGGELHEIVGVMPRDFRSYPSVDVWTPFRADSRGVGFNLKVIGRLRGGVSRAQAASELEILSSAYTDIGPTALGRDERFSPLPYRTTLTRTAWPPLQLLVFAAGLLFVMACANTSGLMITRISSRQPEFAMRMSLGCTRWGIVRVILLDSVAIGSVGSVAGLAIAFGVLQVLDAFGMLPSMWQPVIDGRAIAMAAVAGLVASAFIGLLPALALRPVLGLVGSVNENSYTGTSSIRHVQLRRALVVTEVVLSVAMLTVAALLVRSFVSLQQEDLGFQPDSLLTIQMSLNGRVWSGTDLAMYYDSILADIRSIPAVRSAAVVSNIPVDTGLNVPIRSPTGTGGGLVVSVEWRYATTEYFRTMGIPLKQGRAFTEVDGPDAMPVAIVNDAFVRRFGLESDIIGTSVRIYDVNDELTDPSRRVVGVVGNAKERGLGAAPSPTLYVPIAQVQEGLLDLVHLYFNPNWVVRTHGEPALLLPTLERMQRSSGSRMSAVGARSMRRVIDDSIERRQLHMFVMTGFGVVGLTMSAFGFYALIGYIVALRTREIAIRMALGATAGRTIAGILKQSLVLAATGLVIALVIVRPFTGALRSRVYGLDAWDPNAFFIAASLAVATCAVTSVIAARRVATLTLATTLRR